MTNDKLAEYIKELLIRFNRCRKLGVAARQFVLEQQFLEGNSTNYDQEFNGSSSPKIAFLMADSNSLMNHFLFFDRVI